MQRGAAQGNGWTYFISHKQSDSATEALELTVQLGKGACWLDVHQRDAGQKAMENGVRNSQFFVCILSPGYLESKWCMTELEWAFTFSKPIILCYRAADNVGAILQRLPSEFASLSNIQGIKLDRSHPDFFQVAINMIHERVGDATGSSDGISKVRRGKEAIEHWKKMRATVFTVVAARRFREGGKEYHRSNHELDVLPDIALRKLENPQLQLNADQQLEVLEACIAAGKQQAVRATDKQLVMVIGNTGAGKSTLVNYLHGCQMELHKTTDDIGKKKKVIRVREDSSPPELMEIGHTNKSATFMPKVDGGDDTLTFADCPGFLDNRGAEINIANAVNIKAAVSKAAGIRVLILLNYHSLKADRGRGIRELAQILADLFGDARRMGEHINSALLGLSQANIMDNDGDALQLSDFHDLVSDTTGLGDDAAEIIRLLASKMFVYDPLNRGDETWSVRDHILASLRSLPSIAEPGDVFRTVLTAEDERTLRACVNDMSKRLREGMERREYEIVAGTLRQLNALEGIGRSLVTKLLADARDKVVFASTNLKDQAVRSAMTQDFDEAENCIRELKRASNLFKAGGSATKNIAQRVNSMCEEAAATVSRMKFVEKQQRRMIEQLQVAQDRYDALQRQVQFLEEKAREDRERADAQRAELEKERSENERKRKDMAEAFEAERKQLEERMAESNEAEVRKKMQEELKRLEAERDAQEREAREASEKRERQLREQAEASARRAAEAEKERQSLMSAARKEQEEQAFLKSNSQLARTKDQLNQLDAKFDDKMEEIVDALFKVQAQQGNERASSLEAMKEALPAFVIRSNDAKKKAIIGEGGFGVVHEAMMKGTQVAVKELHAHRLNRPSIKDFIREANILSQLKHPNVMAFYGVILEPPMYAMVIQYLGNGCVHDSLVDEDQELAWSLRMRWALGLVAGVNYLHNCDPVILHGDIKSMNLLLDANKNAVLCDFGMAKIKRASSASTTTIGGEGITVKWTPPEIFNGSKKSKASDMYSVAVTLWEIACRDLPLPDMPDPAYVMFIRGGERPPLPTREETGCPTHYGKVVDACWAQRPDSRMSAAKALEKLKEMLVELDEDMLLELERQELDEMLAPRWHEQAQASTWRDNKEIIKCLDVPSDIHQLIAVKNWSEVNACLSANPGKAREKDNFGHLPLHDAAYHAPADVVRMLLEAYPEGAREKNNYGELPLHMVAQYRHPRVDVVRMLMDAYPEGKKDKSNGGRLPVHLAKECHASAEVIKLLDVPLGSSWFS